MTSRLIDFALAVHQLLAIKIYGIIEILKIEIFSFSGTEKVKQNLKRIKKHSKLPSLVIQSLFNKS